jgi:hypothetical protein
MRRVEAMGASCGPTLASASEAAAHWGTLGQRPKYHLQKKKPGKTASTMAKTQNPFFFMGITLGTSVDGWFR